MKKSRPREPWARFIRGGSRVCLWFSHAIRKGCWARRILATIGLVVLLSRLGKDQASAGSPETTPPSRPANLTLTAKTDHSVTLAWDASLENVTVSGYEVLRDGASAGSTAATSFTCDGLSTGVSYTFRVRARDPSGNVSPASNAVLATPQAGSGSVQPALVRTQFSALVLNYDPMMLLNGSSVRVADQYNYRNVDDLVAQYIQWLKQASGGQTVWSVAYRFDLNEFPSPARSTQTPFTADNYASLRSQGYDYWNMGGPDYKGILRDARFGITDKVNAGQVDAVWVFSPAGSGFWETAMAGPSAYWVNGGPIYDTLLERNVVFYGFGKEGHQGVGYMCENTCHMLENIMGNHIASDWPRTSSCQTFVTLNLDNPARAVAPRLVNDWTHFMLVDATAWDAALVAPGQAQAGFSHFPPTAIYNYDWATVSFDFSNATAFHTYGGTWSLANNEYHVLAPDPPSPWTQSYANPKALAFDNISLSDNLGTYAAPMAFSDADVELNVRVANQTASSHAGLLFRVSNCQAGVDQVTGYYAGLNAADQQVVLWKLANAPHSILAQAAYPLAANQNYRLRLEARASQINLYLEGSLVPLISCNDSSYRSGAFGLAAYSTEAFFSNLTIVAHSLNHADDWYAYPAGTGAMRDLSPLDWNGDTVQAMDNWYAWWWEHLPKNGGGHYATDSQSGQPVLLLNTWWPYIFDINRFNSRCPFPDIVFPPEDVTPPSAPGVIQGLPLGPSRMALSWDPADDNVGVTRYAVYRDGALLRTTAQPTFVDNRLSPNTHYSYTVRAQDGSANLSVPSPSFEVTTPGTDFEAAVIDPGFEITPQAGGWSTDAYLATGAGFVWEAPPCGHNGTRCVRISASQLDDLRWIQTVNGLTPGGTYWLSGWIKGDNIVLQPGGQVGANLCLYGTWEHTAARLAGTFDWTRVIDQFTAPASGSIIVGCRLGYWGNTASGKAWFDDILLSTSNPALDQAPVANPDVIERYAEQDVKVAVSTLLANDTDPDGDPLSLIWVTSPTANKATVVLDGDWVFYTPPSGFTGNDQFTYVVSDGRGETAAGAVQVQIKTDNSESHNKAAIEDLHNGCFRVTFNGIPDRTYTVQYSQDLIHWQVLGSASADPLGIYCFEDTAGDSTRFYRSIYP
jgi:chitodextrinase